jgi:DNA-binding NtrC family response regulator
MTSATVLILSADSVAAALVGALIETLGYTVRFGQPSESPDEALRRVRPEVCLIDCAQPDACSAQFLGRARMRSVAVVLFGAEATLVAARPLAAAHGIDVLAMPADSTLVEQAVRRARASMV